MKHHLPHDPTAEWHGQYTVNLGKSMFCVT